MRYLLDELMAYEEGFSDILMQDRAGDRHETFMGEMDTSKSVTKLDLMMFQTNLLEQVQKLILTSSSAPSTPVKDYNSLLYRQSHTRSPSPSPSHISYKNPTHTSYPTPRSSPNKTVAAPEASKTAEHSGLLRPTRIPTCNSLDDAIMYWEEGDKERGLIVPLQSWVAVWPASEYRSEAAKFGNIRQVYEEYKFKCKGDMDLFESRYPGLRFRFTLLLKAVRAARITRKEAKGRNRTSRRK